MTNPRRDSPDGSDGRSSRAAPPGWSPSLEALFIGAFVLLGIRLGARGIYDNSAFVHLRTGVDIAAGHGIPRTDPYSFTAAGESWVVQSWLAASAYGWIERAGGIGWVVAFNGALMGALAGLSAWLARTGRPLATGAAGLVVVAAGAAFWAPRPLLFGLIALALTIVVVERGARPWWLVPIVWMWVNTHGSFPLGMVWLGGVVLGSALDARSWRAPMVPWRYAGAFVLGLVVAAVNPLGPRLLTFALTIGEKRQIFATVVEWRSPDFQRPGGLVTLLAIVAGLGILMAARHRPPWRDVVPVAGFLALALVATRNLPMLAVVLAPALGRALRPTALESLSASPAAGPVDPVPGPAWAWTGSGVPASGSTGGSVPTLLPPTPAGEPPPGSVGGVPVSSSGGPAAPGIPRPAPLNHVIAAVLVAAGAVFMAAAVRGPGLDLGSYPIDAVAWLERNDRFDRPHRTATQDTVGGYLVLREGRRGVVFIDDRVDMYPLAVSRDYRALLDGSPRALRVLDRHGIDTVLWERDKALVTVLKATGDWREVHRDGRFVVLVRVLEW